MRRYLFFSLSFFFTLSAQAAVWEDTNVWNLEWEKSYQKWVSENWSQDFFSREGIYQGLKVDCADAVYAARYVFAEQHGLPFVVNDPTGGGRLISNQMTRWDHQPEPDKKRDFLNYLFQIMSTYSLPYDTYLVDVNREAITAGTLFLASPKKQHSWLVRQIEETGVPFLVYSSMTSDSMMFSRIEFPATDFAFPEGFEGELYAGFRAFRWPEYLQVLESEVPGYSSAQHQIPLENWISVLQEILKTRDEEINELVKRQLDAVCDGTRERIIAVREALTFLETRRQCMNQDDYDLYSTPNRDQRLQRSFRDLIQTYEELVKNQGLSHLEEPFQAALLQIFEGRRGEFCPLGDKIRSHPHGLHEVAKAFENGKLSSNPYDSLEARWGLDAEKSELARRCRSY